MSRTPRRPAQLDAEQIEAIEGDSDVAYNSELAHTSAQALVPIGQARVEQDLEAVKRIIALVDDEGVDVLAESWVRSPEDTLPGILWRGYLLREWIRRSGNAVADRYEKVVDLMKSQGADGELKISMTPKPGTILQEWNTVLAGTFEGTFEDVLTDSARITNFLGEVNPAWIETDQDQLANIVTRRDRALMATSAEFRHAAALASEGLLE